MESIMRQIKENTDRYMIQIKNDNPNLTENELSDIEKQIIDKSLCQVFEKLNLMNEENKKDS